MRYIIIFLLLTPGLTSWCQTIPPYTAPGAPIDAVEYFIDSDPGFGQGTALQVTSGQDIIIDTVIDVSQIEPGIHTLHVRARDTSSHWSLIQSNIFWVNIETFFYQNNAPLANITRIEYFLDIDPGLGNGIALNNVEGPDIFIDTALDVSSLDPGIHTLHVRARNQTGTWSQIQSNIFWIDVESFFKVRQNADKKIAKIEYFIDNDPGLDQGFLIPGIDSTEFTWSDKVCVSSIDSGQHYIHARTQDVDGAWSHLQIDTFNLTKNVSPQVVVNDQIVYLDSLGRYLFSELETLVDSTIDLCEFDTTWIDVDTLTCSSNNDSILVNFYGMDIHGAFVSDSFHVFVQDTFQVCCVDSLSFTDTIIQSGIYGAIVYISAQGMVGDTSNVLFQAGQTIDLLPPFEVKPGGEFEANMIDPCAEN